MKKLVTKSLLSLALALGTTATVNPAWATPQTETARLRLRTPVVLLADNVVVTPSSGTSSPQGTPQAATPVQAVPVQAAPAQAPAVVESSSKRTDVHAQVDAPHNYMSTIAVSGLMGGLVGVLVGGSIYFLGDQTHARNIAYWGAGGVLLGVGVGVVQVAVQESRLSNATALNRFPSDPAPTFRLALLSTRF